MHLISLPRIFATFICLAWPLALSTSGWSATLPLTITDTRGTDGALTVETNDWKLVFSERFNGGPHQWYDLAWDPTETDNLTTESNGGNYGQGALFDYDVYLGNALLAVEFMTTMGSNADPGTLQLDILEATGSRVRIRQRGHPRLNNGQGPPGDPFPELTMVDCDTIWTIYPTGKVGIDFSAQVNPAGQIVNSGPGGAGQAVSAPGCCGFENWVNATNGTDFLESFVWVGDTIESVAGGWGPIKIAARPSPTQLVLEDPVPAGTNLDYTIRRERIHLETISIHADGDPDIVNQCSDPAVSRWEGGSNGDPVWSLPIIGDSCKTKRRDTTPGGGLPPISDDVVLAHWAKDRPAGSMLAFFEPWVGVNAGWFNDEAFTDISYTQLGRLGNNRLFEPHDRAFMAQMGSSAAPTLPTIQSVADSLPYADDYRTPFATALDGSLETGGDIAAYGFNPKTASYEIVSDSCTSATILFDAFGNSRGGLAYQTPAVMFKNFHVADAGLTVELSTDGGNSFSILPAVQYNLTESIDEAELGTGKRLFQLLGDIPGTATTASAWAVRVTGSGVCPSTTTSTTTSTTSTTTTTIPAPNPFYPRKLRASRLLDAPGQQRLSLSSREFPRNGVLFLPSIEDFSVEVSEDQALLWSVQVPAGDPDWTINTVKGKYRWKPEIPGTGPQGLRSLVLRSKGTVFKLRLKAKDTDATTLRGITATANIALRLGGNAWAGEIFCSTATSGKRATCKWPM